MEIGSNDTRDRRGDVLAAVVATATMAVARRWVCGIVSPCTVVAGILSVGMQGDEGDGQMVMMVARMTGRIGGC